MKVSFRLIIVFFMVILLFSACSIYQSEDTKIETESNDEVEEISTEESENINIDDEKFFIEDYNDSTWEASKFAIEAVRDIFILREQYYNREFNYSVLIDGLGRYFDLPKTFIKADAIYGFKVPNDYETYVTNGDTARLTDVEFEELLDELTYFAVATNITLVDAEDYAYDAIQSVRRRFFISSVTEKDDNSIIIYLKVLNTYDNMEALKLPFDTVVEDHWFLFKRDSGMIYSHKSWSTNGYESEIDTNFVQIREQELEMQMFEITNSILVDD